MKRNDVAYDIVVNATKTKYSDLSENTVRISKKFILDTVGVAIAGSTAPGCKEVVSYIKTIGGKKESTIFLFGGKVPNFNAAFTNSMMCHALDFDDTHEGAIVHANASILPSVLAMAESVKGISGETFIVAYALGVDFACRIGLATGLNQGWHYSSVCGYFGSALASSIMMGLNETEMLNALGIAYSQVGGTDQCIVDAALVKRMQPAFAARGGVFSAMLAKQGITGAKGIFEGEFGFFTKFERGHADILQKNLGKIFEVEQLSLKPYPSCGCTHGAITGAMDLVREHDIQPDDIEQVRVITSRYNHRYVGKPFEIRDNPQVDAQFSIPYTVAASIINRRFGIAEIQENTIRNEHILSFAERVKCEVDDSIKNYPVPVEVRIDLKNGTSFSKKVEILKGNPSNPTTEEEDFEKFNDCLRFGIKKISMQKRDRLIRSIRNLETLIDVQELIEDLR